MSFSAENPKVNKAKRFRVQQRISNTGSEISQMCHRELFVSQANVFAGFQKPFEKADYVVLGVPFDVTSTYRTGARFGPAAIRQASANIETCSLRSGIDVEDLHLHDLGDLHVASDTEKTLRMLQLVTEDTVNAGKTCVTIGGEHTITLGIARGLESMATETAIISFDAHLDLRNEFLGLKVSHTTFMRRISEKVKPARIIEVGTRAVCKEELSYADKAGIEFFTAQQIRTDGSERIVDQLKRRVANYKYTYLSVDMDILDPAYVPAVQNPEADGLEMHTLLDILNVVCDDRVLGFDVVEVAPNYDQGISAIQAAKVIFEILCQIEKSRA
jgi:agmatinase